MRFPQQSHFRLQHIALCGITRGNIRLHGWFPLLGTLVADVSMQTIPILQPSALSKLLQLAEVGTCIGAWSGRT